MDQVNILALAAFLAAAAAALLLKRPKDSKPSAVALLPPPVASGVSTIAALGTLVTKGLTAVIHDLHAELGSVFTVSLLGLKKVTFLIGPEVTAHFFEGSESEIRQSDIYKITVPVFGRGVLFDVDLPTRRRQIRFLSDAIKPVKLRGQVDSMVREVELGLLRQMGRAWHGGSEAGAGAGAYADRESVPARRTDPRQHVRRSVAAPARALRQRLSPDQPLLSVPPDPTPPPARRSPGQAGGDIPRGCQITQGLGPSRERPATEARGFEVRRRPLLDRERNRRAAHRHDFRRASHKCQCRCLDGSLPAQPWRPAPPGGRRRGTETDHRTTRQGSHPLRRPARDVHPALLHQGGAEDVRSNERDNPPGEQELQRASKRRQQICDPQGTYLGNPAVGEQQAAAHFQGPSCV
ncbi:uncharacterized protein LOC123396711 isoform X1 [Hordeum vulgare subsp. vulgare]|uniref:uncharacterized protein LOC123396711 isoform X1 n=1 Tax=Hordeum vulgare subsp. vulgare TaxID=112509 RepID=UPI001D1A3A9D|nr:uncharacterized protein LOC123396711 isoform X1 [Hordeum vulgare subsp. vulgare]